MDWNSEYIFAHWSSSCLTLHWVSGLKFPWCAWFQMLLRVSLFIEWVDWNEKSNVLSPIKLRLTLHWVSGLKFNRHDEWREYTESHSSLSEWIEILWISLAHLKDLVSLFIEWVDWNFHDALDFKCCYVSHSSLSEWIEMKNRMYFHQLNYVSLFIEWVDWNLTDMTSGENIPSLTLHWVSGLKFCESLWHT